MKNFEIVMSICCISYNHEKYIKQALDSFLMQITDFKFEIIIGEDCSTDQTRAIIESYCQRYPDIIHLLVSDSNVGAIKNQVRVINKAKGKYIAMCDGDDYWSDPLKLQKQVDFMESHPQHAICCHYTKVIDEQGKLVYVNTKPEVLEFAFEDVLLGKKEETRICSLVARNNGWVKEIGMEDWYYKTFGTDTLFKLYIMAWTNGKIYVLPEVMAVYRLHRGGIWSLIDGKVRKGRMISDFNVIINNFRYSSISKKELLKMYISQYLLFDMWNLNISKAYHTLTKLI
ncbi:glycosyltransferase [Arcticibacter svalbardensis]|nr:glycosyltransferase [Arcticibacter svalbardensis]